MEHVVFITSNYPSEARPACGTFVRQLVFAIANQGVKCSVISPVSVFDVMRFGERAPAISVDSNGGAARVRTLRPRYVSFSNKGVIGYNTARLTQATFERAARGALSVLDAPPTILYGHFLYPGGGTAVRVAEEIGIPSIVAVGESTFWSVEPMGYRRASEDLGKAGGFVAVSEEIKRNLMERLYISEEKIRVFPNGVDLERFYPRDRLEMRRKFGLPHERFIIAFVGHFDQRKGPHRVLAAASGLEKCGLIFMGRGSAPLEGEDILFKGQLSHSEVPEMLSAADIFVLPTLAEGSCNAIVEALACGLPVVTSRREFNSDIADDGVAIMVDPMDINEIREAIILLRDEPSLRKKMSTRALMLARERNIHVRASNIIRWMEEVEARSMKTGGRSDGAQGLYSHDRPSAV